MNRLHQAQNPWLLNCGLLITLLVLALASLGIGPVGLSSIEIVSALFSSDTAADPRQHIIVVNIRLPRIILAVLVGGSLGMAGAALQGLLRNPLAEPGLLGITSSASFGAVVCLYFGLAGSSAWLLPVSAMSCAALATLVLYGIAHRSSSTLTLILAGVALSSLAAALTSLTLNIAPEPADVQDMVHWLLGSLRDRSYNDIQLCLPFVLAGTGLLLASGNKLNSLTLGEDEARSLGINLNRLRQQVIVGTALCVGASVAISGAIGFVGLVVPHVLRRFVQYHPSRLLLSSALGGAILLLAADTLLRLFSDTRELMLGVVTALIGAPFFFALVLKNREVAG